MENGALAGALLWCLGMEMQPGGEVLLFEFPLNSFRQGGARGEGARRNKVTEPCDLPHEPSSIAYMGRVCNGSVTEGPRNVDGVCVKPFPDILRECFMRSSRPPLSFVYSELLYVHCHSRIAIARHFVVRLCSNMPALSERSGRAAVVQQQLVITTGVFVSFILVGP